MGSSNIGSDWSYGRPLDKMATLRDLNVYFGGSSGQPILEIFLSFVRPNEPNLMTLPHAYYLRPFSSYSRSPAKSRNSICGSQGSTEFLIEVNDNMYFDAACREHSVIFVTRINLIPTIIIIITRRPQGPEPMAPNEDG
jgi:hypothetical protein